MIHKHFNHNIDINDDDDYITNCSFVNFKKEIEKISC